MGKRLAGYRKLAWRLLRNRWIFRFVGIGLFALILLRIDLKEAWRTLARVDLAYIALSLVFQAFSLGVATLRWQLLMRGLELRQPFWRTASHQLIGTAAALVTPGQLGEFVKVLYHRREGFPLLESLLSVLLDRLFDLATLLAFSLLALALLFGAPGGAAVLLAAGGLLAFLLVLLLARHRPGGAPRLAKALVLLIPRSYRAPLRQDARQLVDRLRSLGWPAVLQCAFLTGANYLFLLLRIYALVLALHLDVPFWYFAVVVPLLRLVGLIPISILGIGTRDIAAIYLLGRAGVPAASAVLVSTLGLITVQAQTLAGFLAWWRDPLNLRQAGLLSAERKALAEGESASPAD